jgi:hypothetical protein
VSWTQNTDEVLIKVPVATSVRGRDVQFEVHPTRLRLEVDGRCLLQGNLSDAGALQCDGELAAPPHSCRNSTPCRAAVAPT